MEISVVVPIFNEDKNIQLLYDRLLSVFKQMATSSFELLFVNDGSTDKSLTVLKQLAGADTNVRFLDLSRNFGHQIAVMAGLDNAKGESIIIIDADLQDPPELIPKLLQRKKQGFDVVYAKRKTRKNEGLPKKVTARLFYRLLDSITTIPIPLDTGDFRVVSRRVVDVLKQMPEQEKFLRGQIAWMGFDQSFVEYDRDGRHAGDTGYTWRKMIRFALDGITSFSDFPLKLATLSGFIVSFISFLLMIYALYSRFILKVYEPGWTSLMLSVLFIGGIQLLAVGIIGEYIGRISNNVKKRPLYLIKETSLRKNQNPKSEIRTSNP